MKEEIENLETGPEERRRFLGSMAGSLAFLALGAEGALGRSLFLRHAAADEEPINHTYPTTVTASESHTESQTIEPRLSWGWSWTEPHTGTGTWSMTTTPGTVTKTRTGTHSVESGTATWSWTWHQTETHVHTPPFSQTFTYSAQRGVVTVAFTGSYTPTIPRTADITKVITASWTTTTDRVQGFGFEIPDPAMLPVVESIDLGIDLSDPSTRHGDPLDLAFVR